MGFRVMLRDLQRGRCSGELPWTQQNSGRIGFAAFCHLAPAAASLRVHASSQIARTRADFERFSEMSENLETGVWMTQSDANRSPAVDSAPCQPVDTMAWLTSGG